MKVALVTGASRGIGAAIAERLAEDGLQVVGVSRTHTESEAGTEHVRADVSREEDVQQLVDDVENQPDPDGAASLATWLASDEAAFASGQPYVIDGALTAGRTFRWGR